MSDIYKRLETVRANDNFRDILAELSETFSEQVIFSFDNGENQYAERSYKEFVTDVIDTANWIYTRAGNREDKHLAAFVENKYEYSVIFVACLCGAAVLTIIDGTLNSNAIIESMTNLDVDLILYDKAFGKKLENEGVLGFGSIEMVPIDLLLNYRKNTNVTTAAFNFTPKPPDALHIIMPTSGTSEKYAKNVMLSADNILACLESNIEAGMNTFRFLTRQKFLSVLPLTHVYGIMSDVLLPLCCGDEVYLSQGIEQMETEFLRWNPTILCTVPSVAERLLKKYKALERRKPESAFRETFGTAFRQITLAGAAISENLIRAYHEIGCYVMRGYGMSETTANVIMSLPIELKPDYRTIGQVMPNVEIRIVDGEICVKSRSVMLGYYHNEALTNMTIVDGWLKTGDAGFFGEDGSVYFTGRIKNMIVLENGENIAPEELEDCFKTVNGVEECIVFAKEDKKLCLLVRTNTSYQLYKDLSTSIYETNRTLPYGKQVTEVILTETPIPRTFNGKILRSKLKQYIQNSEIQMNLKGLVDSMMYTKCDIKAESQFKTDLELNSLDLMILWKEVCDKYDITIRKEDFLKFSCIAEISAYISTEILNREAKR